MRQYSLGKYKLLQMLRKYDRKEEGIAPGTTALMKKAPKGEIWIMYKENKNLKSIISAWRYPGISKPGEQVPTPLDIKEELSKEYA